MIEKVKQYRPSMNARAVARTVIAKLEKGEKVKLAPILRAHGYSASMADRPKNVTEQEGYKEEIESYAKRLEAHRDKIILAMERKDLNEEQYRTLADAQSKVTHDVQLLTGGKTENVGVQEDRNILIGLLAEVRGETPKLHEHNRGTENKIEGPPAAL